MTKASRIKLGLLVAPLVLPTPVVAFILWDSLRHWRTTSLTFSEYYALPLAILFWYLVFAYLGEAVLLILFYAWRSVKDRNETPTK